MSMSEHEVEITWNVAGVELDALRGAVRDALVCARLPRGWSEWREGDPLRPRHLARARGLTLWVNHREVWSAREPLPDELAERITRAAERPFRRCRREPLGRRLRWSLLPALALVILPKCPLCWAAYVGVVSGAGLSLPGLEVTALALAATLAIAVGAVWMQGLAIGWFGPTLLATLGASIVFFGRFALDSPWLRWTGLALLTFAALQSAWRRTARSTSSWAR
jgi:hypothetical protein